MSDNFFNDILIDPDFLRPTGPPGGRNDPYGAFNFVVEVEGLIAGGFSEVSGLQVEVDVHRQREGGENMFEYQLPGPASYPQRLSLRRGLTSIDLFWDWIQQVARGIVIRRNITISLLDLGGGASSLDQRIVMSWDCRRAFPVRWSGPELNAGGGQVAMESIELVHHGIARGAGLSKIVREQLRRAEPDARQAADTRKRTL